jgi:hypothetical protein
LFNQLNQKRTIKMKMKKVFALLLASLLLVAAVPATVFVRAAASTAVEYEAEV